jgi:hypothetical protein
MDRCMRSGSFFIGIRFTPLESLPADPLASSEEGGSDEVISGMRKTLNPIDTGIFPTEFQPLTTSYPFAR